MSQGPLHGFGRARRLVHKRAFTQVFRAPARFSDRCFTILATPNGRPEARLGLAISRRVARRAVDRNRLKRLIRESFRLADGLTGVDVVVMAKPGAAAVSNERLRQSLDRHWVAAGKRFRGTDTADG